MSARWHCKICRTYGFGGPSGWATHQKAAHSDNDRYSASISFGFAPNYSNGRRSSHRLDYVMPPRAGERP